MLITTQAIPVHKDPRVTTRKHTLCVAMPRKARGQGCPVLLRELVQQTANRDELRQGQIQGRGTQASFLFQERSLELSSLVTPHNSRWLQIYYCILPNLEGFHFWPHKRKTFSFPQYDLHFLFWDKKIHYSNSWKNKTTNKFLENSLKFCNGFGSAGAFPLPHSSLARHTVFES